MNKFVILILLLANSTAFAAKTPAAACLASEEIGAALSEDWERLQPLIRTIPLPISLIYKDLKLPILGYADFTKIGEVSIRISGQFCRNLMYRDELSVLLCHELGHAAGGAPVMSFLGGVQSLPVTAEGQADFFASSSCLPLLWGSQVNAGYLEKAKVHPELEKICAADGKSNEQRGLCMRIASATYNFTRYVRQGTIDENEGMIPPRDPGAAPKLDVKDKMIVKKTITREHPKPQCRLDTFLAGLACQANHLPANYSVDPKASLSCGVSADLAPRPACWYAPESEGL